MVAAMREDTAVILADVDKLTKTGAWVKTYDHYMGRVVFLHRNGDSARAISYYLHPGLHEAHYRITDGRMCYDRREDDEPTCVCYYTALPERELVSRVPDWDPNKKLERLLRSADSRFRIPEEYIRGIRYRQWYRNNRLHRPNGLPAVIKYREDGSVVQKQWYVDGRKLREEVYPTSS